MLKAQFSFKFEQLRPHGYTNIDAIDGSQEMLAFAQKKKLYQNVQVALLGGEHKAPIADGEYQQIFQMKSSEDETE